MSEPSEERLYQQVTRQGTLVAGLAGIVAAESLIFAILGGIPSDMLGWSLNLGAALGAGLGLAGFWRLLVPRNGGFSLPLAPVAGLAAGVAAHAVMWLAFFLVAGSATSDSLRDVAAALGFTVSLMALSMLLAGAVTIPVAILAALAITAWCRWRLGRAA